MDRKLRGGIVVATKWSIFEKSGSLEDKSSLVGIADTNIGSVSNYLLQHSYLSKVDRFATTVPWNVKCWTSCSTPSMYFATTTLGCCWVT